MWFKKRPEKQEQNSSSGHKIAEGINFPAFETAVDVLSPFSGEWEAFFKGEGYDFSDLREWQPGDPVSRMHIPSSVKTGKDFVVERIPERSLSVVVVGDFSDSINKNEILKTMRTVAILLVSKGAISQDNELEFIAFSNILEEYIPSSFSPIQRDRIWQTVGKLEENIRAKNGAKTTDFSVVASALNGLAPAKSIVFCISDFWVPIDQTERLIKEAGQFDFVPVLLDSGIVWDSLPPGRFLCSFQGAEEKAGAGLAFVDSGEAKKKEEKRILALQSLFERYGLAYVHLKNTDPFDCVAEFTKCFRKKIQQRR